MYFVWLLTRYKRQDMPILPNYPIIHVNMYCICYLRYLINTSTINPFVGPSEMTFGTIESRTLHNMVTHYVTWANQETEKNILLASLTCNV